MSAILHCIITEIENNRIKDNIKYWRWMSNIYHNKQDTMNHLCEDIIIDNETYMCLNYEECGGCHYSYTYVPRGERLCERCNYEPDWTDAFSKWGHNDGGSTKCITGDVVEAIEDLGYDCCGNEDTEHYDAESEWLLRYGWGCHNCEVITKIVKSDTGEVVYPIDGFRVGGYDDRCYCEVLPADILEAIIPINYNADIYFDIRNYKCGDISKHWKEC
jgi:hypothetical protein